MNNKAILISKLSFLLIALVSCSVLPSSSQNTGQKNQAPTPFQALGKFPTPTQSKSESTILADNFSNPSSGWSVHQGLNSTAQYSNGSFVFKVDKPDTATWSTLADSYKDVIIEVDVTQTAGPNDDLFGVICRFQDANNFYRFVIGANGYAGITKRTGGTVNVISASLLSKSPAVNIGSSVNHLKAVCQGNMLTLFVNNQLVAQAQDSEFDQGRVGLLAAAGAHSGIELQFTNFALLNP